MKKYLVIGSNSFGGATFVQDLLSQEAEVIGMSRSKEPALALRPYAQHTRLKQFTFYQLDLNRDFEAIQQLILNTKPNYVIDFASQSMVAESWRTPEQWYQTNIVAKVKLHDFLRTCDFMERYIRISTPEVYGHHPGKVAEGHPFQPTTPYAISQAATDMGLIAFYKQYGFPVILTRFANFYGTHQQLYRIIPRVIVSGLLGKKLPLHGGGISKRAFIYGSDVSSAILTVIAKGRLGETYHFSEGECIPIADVVRKICELMKLDYDQLVSVTGERPGKDFQYFLDSRKAEQELSWKPKISLMEGLQRTIGWGKQHIAEIKTLSLEYIHKP